MKICKIAKLLWKNKVEIPFGNNVVWGNNPFFKNNCQLYNNKAGLYWITSDIALMQLCLLKTPQNLHLEGCKFGETVFSNNLIFKENTCHDFGLGVLYNGQADKVFSRLQKHFNINGNTSALDINKYNLSTFQWSAFVFHVGMIDNLQSITKTERRYIENLLLEKTGRCSIEFAWRALYGQPILCKE